MNVLLFIKKKIMEKYDFLIFETLTIKILGLFQKKKTIKILATRNL